MATNAVRLIAPVLLGAFILLFPADGLRALGLGEARVDSWLGQPLDVTIRLLANEDESLDSLSVRPAELADFERLGVPSDSLAYGLRATLDRSVSPPRVRVRSERTVNDPVVQVLIDARWASGRVLREYTLFLDPPVVDSAPPARRVEQSDQPAQAAPPAQAETREAPQQRQAEPAQPREQAPPERAPRQAEPEQASAEPARAPAAGGETVPVSPGDTLWGIASEWRPDNALSMDQVMLAIFNSNRGAFLQENINRLRSDARLTMPGLEEVRSVSRSEAERLVREHMRAWQSATDRDVPVVSSAAVPEADEQGSRQERARASDQTGSDHRLDVVPLEEDESADGTAVSEGEIRRVNERLADVESEIAAESLESGEFDDRITEIRESLEQQDLAGLAVAEEGLAELQQRLREVRQARAEDAASVQDEPAAQADRVSDYLRQLEGELGLQDSGTEAEPAVAASDAEAGADESVGAADPAAVEEERGDEEAVSEEAMAETSADRADPGRAATSGWTALLWPVVGALVLLVLIVALVAWKRRRGGQAMQADASAGPDELESARSAVARSPGDLGAHLALLEALAHRRRSGEFTEAFDRMYQQVDDESDTEWQRALALASTHAPDHPLLSPTETAADEGADLDRRADEMLGMLDAGDDEPDEGRAGEEEPEPEASEQGGEEALGEDMDLAAVSGRLDDPAAVSIGDVRPEGEGDDTDFEQFDEEDEYGSGERTAADEESEPEPFEPDTGKAPEDELDLGPAREQEADDVVGESGTREREDMDLDFDFTSEVEGESADELSGEQAAEFDLDETLGEETVDQSAGPEQASGADDREPGDGDQESEEPEAALSDEDADVKLDLARAYVSVDLADSARGVLEEVISDGSEAKRAEARKLLDQID